MFVVARQRRVTSGFHSCSLIQARNLESPESSLEKIKEAMIDKHVAMILQAARQARKSFACRKFSMVRTFAPSSRSVGTISPSAFRTDLSNSCVTPLTELRVVLIGQSTKARQSGESSELWESWPSEQMKILAGLSVANAAEPAIRRALISQGYAAASHTLDPRLNRMGRL